jgi:hypothetical protein
MRDDRGRSHRIGHVSDFASIRSNAADLLARKRRCDACPALPVCKRGCALIPATTTAHCPNAYSDSAVVLALGINVLTGGVLTRIDGENLPEDRKDIFGLRAPRAPQGISLIMR